MDHQQGMWVGGKLGGPFRQLSSSVIAMEAKFVATGAALPAEEEIARPVDPPRGHSRPGNALGVTWEIASTLGASVDMGDTEEAERLVAHRWAWLARDPDWKRLFETAMTDKLADCLEAGLPAVDKYVPLCEEVMEGTHRALWLDGGNFDRLKARALQHRASGRDGCPQKHGEKIRFFEQPGQPSRVKLHIAEHLSEIEWWRDSSIFATKRGEGELNRCSRRRRKTDSHSTGHRGPVGGRSSSRGELDPPAACLHIHHMHIKRCKA